MTSFKHVDSVVVDQPTLPSVRPDAIDQVSADKNPRLRIVMDATHSGVITNRRVYPGAKVQKGYKTFFDKKNGGDAEYDKPVLRHHSTYEDPIGRIVSAQFTQLRQGQDFDYDYKMPDDEGGRGSGVVTLDAYITDPDSMQKIIDGRYLSISVGHSTDAMDCSICDKNIFKCMHNPGQWYDKEGEECDKNDDGSRLCYYITGNMVYNEASFVNMPAQPPAKLINFKWEDCVKETVLKKDHILIESMSRGKKALVRAFELTDDTGDYNLLKGTFSSATQKTVIDMANPKASPAKGSGTSDETGNVHQKAIEVPKKDGSMDSVKTEVKSTKEAKKMDNDTTKKDGLDPGVLAASLEALTKERATLKDELTTASSKITTLEKTVEAKTSEIDRLTKAQTDMQVEMSKALATALASIRVQLKKPDVSGLDSVEKFSEYSTNLSKRSVESLRDSLNDLMLELSSQKPELAEPKISKNEIIADEKVTNPSIGNDKNNVQAGGKTTKTKDAKKPVDQAFS